jgi:hypothetical protein
MLGIPEGEQIENIETGEAAEVVGERTVRFRGSETSITNATRWVLGRKPSRPLQHWRYGARPLTTIYNLVNPTSR